MTEDSESINCKVGALLDRIDEAEVHAAFGFVRCTIAKDFPN